MAKKCILCGSEGSLLHGYVICDGCKNNLRLFSEETVKKQMSKYKGYEKEIKRRLEYIEKDYIKKKIKLLDVLEKIQ